MQEALLRLPLVLSITGLSRASVYAAIQRGEFPAPVQLGARAVAWPASQIDKWVQDRIAAGRRDPADGPSKAGRGGAR